MASDYDWHPVTNGKSVFKVETRNLGWWVLLAILVSVLIHVILYIILGEIQRTTKRAGAGDDIVWRATRDEQPTIDRAELEKLLAEPFEPVDAPQDVKPEQLSELDLTDNSLDEFDLMEQMKEEVIRMAPVENPQIFSGGGPKSPSQALSAAPTQMEISASDIMSQDLAEMRGKLIDSSASVSNNQPILELNQAEDVGSNVDTDEFFKEAAAKAFGNGADEFIKGYTTLDNLVGRTGGIPSGEEKIALPTDILFEYNESELKEQARLSMMKLAFIVQTNPDAIFVIEGHTDSFGADAYNIDLSLKRAKAVRSWLQDRLRIPVDNIQVVGMGKAKPIVSIDGDADAQALNRRVEIIVKQP